MRRCPHCRRPASDGPDNPDRPFCSTRCRELDLAGWLDESYRVPGAPTDDARPPDPSSDDGTIT